MKITLITVGMFTGCSSLETIKIPTGITSIENGAFLNCTSLKEVIFEENSQLISIGASAFKKCIKLKSIEIPEEELPKHFKQKKEIVLTKAICWLPYPEQPESLQDM